MKIKVTGTIQPPRGTPGANSAYLVDLEVEVPDKKTPTRADQLRAELRKSEALEQQLVALVKSSPNPSMRLSAESELARHREAQSNLRAQLKDATHALGLE